MHMYLCICSNTKGCIHYQHVSIHNNPWCTPIYCSHIWLILSIHLLLPVVVFDGAPMHLNFCLQTRVIPFVDASWSTTGSGWGLSISQAFPKRLAHVVAEHRHPELADLHPLILKFIANMCPELTTSFSDISIQDSMIPISQKLIPLYIQHVIEETHRVVVGFTLARHLCIG